MHIPNVAFPQNIIYRLRFEWENMQIHYAYESIMNNVWHEHIAFVLSDNLDTAHEGLQVW